MVFREVSVIEVREALRAWLAGKNERAVAAQAGVDRKTSRRYVRAAVAVTHDTLGPRRYFSTLTSTDGRITRIWSLPVLGPPLWSYEPERWVTQNGRRIRLRYIGTVKNDAWLHARCGAINLRTLVKAGLTPDGGAWVLA